MYVDMCIDSVFVLALPVPRRQVDEMCSNLGQGFKRQEELDPKKTDSDYRWGCCRSESGFSSAPPRKWKKAARILLAAGFKKPVFP